MAFLEYYPPGPHQGSAVIQAGAGVLVGTVAAYGFGLGTFFHSEKLPAFALLVGMVLTFLGLRVNTHLIRMGVSWWPGNFHRGTIHVHHMVIGLVVMVPVGVLEFAVRPGSPWVEILALLFGGAAGAVLDEFALVLHLKDVYWEHEGRKSVTAVFLATAFTIFMAVGITPLGYSNPLSEIVIVELSVIGIMVANLVWVTLAFFKGRQWMGFLGLFVPLFAIAVAFRLARPRSAWARWQYAGRPDKMAKAERRAADFDLRWGRRQRWFVDLFAGVPGDHRHRSSPAGPDSAPPPAGPTDES
jgi:lysyl-tRNA synthetase class 2